MRFDSIGFRLLSVVYCFSAIANCTIANDKTSVAKLLQEYERAQAEVRSYYSNIAINLEVVGETVAKRRWSDGEVIPNPEREQFRRRFRCVIKGSSFQVQYFDEEETWHTCEVARNGHPVFAVSQHDSRGRLYLPYDAYENMGRYLMQRSTMLPWAIYCVRLSPAYEFPNLDQFLRWPQVIVNQVAELKENDQHLLRIDFSYEVDKSGRRPPYSGSVWLNLDRAWVIVRGQLTYRVRLAHDKFVTCTDDWSLEYAPNDCSVPKVETVTLIYHVLAGATLESSYLYTKQATYRVTAIQEDVSHEAFTPEEFGFTAWDMWSAWLDWIWLRYHPPMYFYYAQLSLVICLVSWIAYRRWRRRRLAGIGGGSATAPA